MTTGGGLVAAVRAGLRPIVACALIGALAGLFWGLSDDPDYAATATVIVIDRGEATDVVGNGTIGGSGPEATDRLLELARSGEVTDLAAASLGGDVAGADLLSQTEFRAGDRGGSLVIRSVAGFPDYAAATANAYAGAITEEASVLEKRRLKRAASRFEEDLAGVDPDSEEGIALADKLDAVNTLEGVDDPVRLGREAELPPAPESDRSASLSALAGFGAGALLAVLFLLAGELRRRPIRTVAQLRSAGGGEPLGALGRNDAAVPTRRPGIFEIAPLAGDRAAAVATHLALDTENRPGTLAVASPMPDEGRSSLALGLAAAAAAAGVSVLLVETDMRRPALAELLSLEPGPGLSDYLAGEASPRDVITAVPVARGDGRLGADPPSFVCVTSGTRTDSPQEMLSSPRFRGLIEQLRRVYDLVIFDAPALLPAPEAILISEATDETVVVVRSGLTRRGELQRALAALSGVRKAGTVLTAAPHAGPGLRRLSLRRGSGFAERRTQR